MGGIILDVMSWVLPNCRDRSVGKGKVQVYESQEAHQAGAYPGFSSVKQLHVGVFLLPSGWDASPSQGYTQR